jgi:hypothetical protein
VRRSPVLRVPAGSADTMPGSAMTPTPPPDPTPAGDPAEPAADTPTEPAAETPTPEAAPKRRWLSRRRPAEPPPEDAADGAAPEAPAETETEHETAAIPEATTPAPPAQDGPRRLRRNRKRILSQREVAVYDLGGLAFELFRRDLLTEEVMVRRAQEVAELDDTVRDIDVRLGEIDRERRERRNRAPADPDVGCCMVCRSPFRADARFCSQCGAQVAPPPIGDEQPTVVIPAPASE